MSGSVVLRLVLVAVLLAQLVVATSNSTALVEDNPQVFNLQRGEHLYFKVDLSLQARGRSLTVIVTPFRVDGDPDLYGDFTEFPGTNARWTAVRYGEDAITITPEQYAGQSMAYFTVSAWLNTRFSIVASFDGDINLSDGIPQASRVHGGAIEYFHFIADLSKTQKVTVTATPSVGHPQVAISAIHHHPDPNNASSFEWSTLRIASGSALVISSDAPNWPGPHVTTFHIGVLGVSPSNFTIVASTSTATLIDGAVTRDHLETGQTEYFDLHVLDTGCTVDITATPFTGDPDIYVSLTDPTPGRNARWTSEQYGADRVQITNAVAGTYHIGVYSFINTTFSLLGKTYCVHGNNTFVELLDSVPQKQSIGSNEMFYYRLEVPDSTKDLTFTLSRQYGDPDIYVRAVPRSAWPLADSQWPNHDDRRTYQWFSNSYGEDLLTIRHTDGHFCAPCYYIVGIYAFTNTSFTLTATTSIITLQAGVPLQEDIQEGEWEYFQLPVDSKVPVTVSITELGQGDPDVFISRIHQFPDREHSEWTGQRIRSDSITISPTDEHACTTYDFLIHNCTYFVGVYSFDGNSTFTILVSLDTPILLQDGVPQHGQVALEAFRYYTFQSACPSESEITFSLGVISGSAQMFVGTEKFPTLHYHSYHWRTSWFSSSTTIFIPHSDPYRCSDDTCMYRVGVYGSTNSTYSLSARTSCGSFTLANGIPQSVHLNRFQWAFFRFNVNTPGRDISFVVTPTSGDPDLFVSAPPPVGRGVVHPNITTADKFSRNYGSDIVDYVRGETGVYYVGVYAFQNSSFSIVAVAQSNNTGSVVTTLFAGEPQSGYIHAGRAKYYSLQLFGDHKDLTFTLSKDFGDPDLYVNFEKSTLPGPNGADYSSNSFRFDQIHINPARNGQYLVAVYGYQSAQYTLTASTDVTHTVLRNNVQVPGSLAAGRYEYYQIRLNDPASDLTITVVPQSGDPDLYIGKGAAYAFPNSSHYMWRAIAFRDDTITIRSDDPNKCAQAACDFYIGVYGFQASVYSIVASYEGTVQLSPGQPLANQFVAHGDMQYYRLINNDPDRDILVNLIPTLGRGRMYVSSGYKPTPTNYTWSTTEFSNHLRIPHGERSSCEQSSSEGTICVYFIGVYGVSDCNFTISANVPSQDVTALRDGEPVQASAEAGTYAYFSFNVLEPNSELDIIVTALTGDPDLYVTTNPQCPRPVQGDPNCSPLYREVQFGSDVLVVPNANITARYNIGVFAFRNSSFTITAYVQNQHDTRSVVTLVDSQPQGGVVSHGGFRYYRIYTPQSGNLPGQLTVQLSRELGDPDLYITYDSDIQHPRRPSQTIYDYRSAAFGEDLLHIPVRPGVFTIAVFGFTSSVYTILAAFGTGPILLPAGVAFTRTLAAGQYDHFVFNVDRLDEDLTITVTPFSGDPDLFIATYAFPNVSHSEYSARNYLEDRITIPHDRLRLGPYYISVQAYNWNTSFTILAKFSNITGLQDGIPQAGEAHHEQTVHYYFRVPHLTLQDARETEVTFTLRPVGGAGYLFVSNTHQPVWDHPETFQWSSRNPYSEQNIRIGPEDAHFNAATRIYYVGVFGVSAMNYTITASLGSSRLRSGVPQRMWVRPRRYAYFYYVVDQIADIEITVTPFTGDPDLYVAFAPITHPNRSSYQFMADQFGADSVRIPSSDPRWQKSTLYIAVYAFFNSTFEVVLSAVPPHTNHTVLLTNGVPQAGRLQSPGEFARYKFILATGFKDLTISMTPSLGDADLYVRDDGQLPTPASAQWNSSHTGRDSISLPQACSEYYMHHCTIDILVVSRVAPTHFTLLVSTSDVSTHLRQGVPLLERLGSGEYAYYVVTVDEPHSILTVSVTPISGDPDLFVSSTNHRPNRTNWEWRSLFWGADSVKINNARQGDYYIGVYAFRNTTFTISANSEATLLVDGRGQRDTAQQGESNLYYFRVDDPQHHKAVDIMLTPITDGSADIFVTNNGSIPSEDLYQWSSNDVDQARDSIEIDPSDGCANCTYFVTVKAHNTFTYNIQYQTSDTAGLLLSGTPVYDSVQKGDSRFYELYLDDVDRDLSILLSSYSGDADLYVSSTSMTPGPNNYQWFSASLSRDNKLDSVIIPSPLQDITYFVGVYGHEAATYSLLATTKDVLLVDGRPQHFTPSTSGSFFLFRIGSEERDRDHLRIYVRYSSEYTFDVYLSNNPAVPQPDSTNTQFHVTVRGGDALQITARDTSVWCLNCTIYVGVFAQTTLEGSADIVMQTSNALTLLGEETTFVSSVLPDGYVFFQMSASSNFSITVEPCTGDVDLFAAPGRLVRKEECAKIPTCRSSTNDDRVDVITALNTAGVSAWYVSVYGRSPGGANGGAADFTIKSEVDSGHSEFPPQLSNRKISLSSPTEGTVTVSFTAATSPTGSPIYYTIYSSSASNNAVMYSMCGLQQSFVESTDVTPPAGSQEATLSATIKLAAGTEYDINVVAKSKQGSGSSATTLASVYRASSITTLGATTSGVPMGLILGVGIPVFALVVIVIGYLCLRNRKLSKELEIEMHDVPRAAVRKAVRGPKGAVHGKDSAKNPKKYSALLNEDEEEDDDGVGTEYAPPDF